MSQSDFPPAQLLSMALISVDVVALRLHQGQLQVLTAPATHPKATFPRALPAGRIDPQIDSELEQTALRQITQLTSAEPSWLEQVETIGNNHRDSRGWSLTVVYFALLRGEPEKDLGEAEWLDIGIQTTACHDPQLPDLAYDHQSLLLTAIERLCSKVQYSTLPLYLLPEVFTLSEIRDVFNCILGKSPPMRSIRNRFVGGNILEDTGEKRYGSNRPASIYRMKECDCAQLFNRLYQTTQ
ncbi:NUDIX hydrolase [Sansalvadorimonas sp. 2012CJ34-2]|uniref:NUDIX hydrolase n=1 Tax=Parendozoicomonas callyspongiae TaxID=2942213 RepID=A0ABT0PJD7_9GAMM|nr:NUDIX hydrolase [Sansalvadorimonas sp. 2012CJ34-2]MCL6271494.1 NUDIX hydrolase [Sansalvadorimonas sp. 2012CJ34-2]